MDFCRNKPGCRRPVSPPVSLMAAFDRVLSTALFVGMVLAAPNGALAHDGSAMYDRADFSVSTGRAVANDRLVAVLYAQAQGERQSALADEVNQSVAWAVDQAKQVDAVKVSTLGYRSNPVYRNQNISGWQVRQSIRLESIDTGALSELLSTLQSRLALESISYDVSPERRDEVEQALISEALAAFRARATQVAEQMGRPGYRIVRISVQTSAGGGPRPMMRGRAMAVAEAQAVSAPSLEGGEQRVEVNVSGEIELDLAQ